MTYVIYKASDDFYCEVKSFETLSELQTWVDELSYPVIIKHNYWWHEWIDHITICLEVDEDKAKKIADTQHALLIYDDYIE